MQGWVEFGEDVGGQEGKGGSPVDEYGGGGGGLGLPGSQVLRIHKMAGQKEEMSGREALREVVFFGGWIEILQS